MSEEKKTIPTKVQKGNRPKIEEVIDYCLDGDLKQSALDFAVYMRENGMPFKLHTSTTRSQRADYKGDHICNILICGDEGDCYRPGGSPYWAIGPNLIHMDKYKDEIISEKLRLNFGDMIYRCSVAHPGSRGGKGCDPNKPCAGGRDLTIFGDGFDGICKWLWPAVENPDEATVRIIKRLLELERMARDNK